MHLQETLPATYSFEFTSGDHVANVQWLDAAKARVDISLRGLALADPVAHAEALLLLHRLNAAARPVHPWIISIDEEDMLLLSATVAAPNSTALQENLAEGLARASSLDALWQTARDGKKIPAETLQDWTAPACPLQFA